MTLNWTFQPISQHWVGINVHCPIVLSAVFAHQLWTVVGESGQDSSCSCSCEANDRRLFTAAAFSVLESFSFIGLWIVHAGGRRTTKWDTGHQPGFILRNRQIKERLVFKTATSDICVLASTLWGLGKFRAVVFMWKQQHSIWSGHPCQRKLCAYLCDTNSF